MNDADFAEFGAYLTKLWPKFTMTPEQRDIWHRRMHGVSLYDAREAAGRAFANSKYSNPRMSDLVDGLRSLHRENPKKIYNDFSTELVLQVEREEEEEAKSIADWSDVERENGRKEIMRLEPGMEMLIGKCHLRAPMLTHFLVERYLYGRIMVPTKAGFREDLLKDAYQ